jgi:hypothetical protein
MIGCWFEAFARGSFLFLKPERADAGSLAAFFDASSQAEKSRRGICAFQHAHVIPHQDPGASFVYHF